MSSKEARLGKGLEALIPKTFLASGKTIVNIPVSEIRPNPYQPRSNFKEESLSSLANSIKTHGLTQPIIVRRCNDHYELIAGERRLRASQIAELVTIPSIIKNISDKESMQLALIENLQREELNPIEVAEGFKRLIDEFSLTHKDIAAAFGRSRSAVTNVLRLLNLPIEIKAALINNEISEGHARAILALRNEEEMLKLFSRVQKENLNVREIEQLVASKNQLKTDRPLKIKNQRFLQFEKNLSALFETKVKIKGDETKGQIVFKYKSVKELERIVSSLSPA